jgi:opacity protein-like surface antigen
MKLNLKGFLLLAALLLCFANGRADTQVDAVISGNQTWTEVGSPYRISRDTLVSAGAVLTLEPGVVVIVSTGSDRNIPSLTPRVDWAIQGRLVVRGTETKPVVIRSVDKDAPWGALYVVATQETPWQFLDMQGGRLVVANAALFLQNGRISSGDGLQVGAQARVDLDQCQIDANQLGIVFLDPSAQVRMTRTRLWDNETALYYKTNGNLTASESSISQSAKWNVVNATAAPVKVPVFWWGSKEATEVTGKVFDGSRRQGIGMVSFEGIADRDPFATNVTGFTPKEDPRKRLWKGPKYLVGLHFQWLIPSLNINLKTGTDSLGNDIVKKVKFKSTLGYGGSVGWLATPQFEMRALVQAAELSTNTPEYNSNLSISLLQTGVSGRYLISLNERKSFFTFVEGGGLMTFVKESNSAPKDPSKPDQNIESRTHKETNVAFEAGGGVMIRLGKSYKAELGARYSLLPLNNNRGGAALQLQAGLSFYFR